MTSGPYALAAWEYWRAGWRGVLPLPPGEKWPPPKGYTGADGLWPSGADIQTWVDGPQGQGNICLRLPSNIIGLDVDQYDGKDGLETLRQLEASYGPLPDGPRSGARSTGGIWYYAVPDGLRWPGDIGDAIEIIQWRHRYAIVWPSVHPSGAIYGWDSEEIPRLDDIPELPESWVSGLTGGHLAQDVAKVELTPGQASEWLRQLGHSEPCRATLAAMNALDSALHSGRGSRHDAMTRGLMRLVLMATEGHRGIRETLGQLYGVWLAVIVTGASARTADAAIGEWNRALDGAIAHVLALPAQERPADPCADPWAGILPPRTAVCGPASSPVCLDDGSGASEAHRAAEGSGLEHRHVVLTPASSIMPRKAHWLWDGRIALGTLALLAGREGLGKSTLGLWVAAAITRGELPGVYKGEPRSVLVSATEDSWAHTLVPRLMAAKADLAKVFQIRVEDADGNEQSLVLPVDLFEVERAAKTVEAALWLMDPLMSRLEQNLDTHRDGDVRKALEPLTALADRTAMGLLGLIHFNKSGGSDPTNIIMGSRAFTAVARSVLTVIPHVGDQEERQRVLSLAKNNLGPDNLPSEIFEIVSHEIPTDDGPTQAGRLEWRGVVEGTVSELMEASAGDAEDRSTTREAAEWLASFLADHGGEADRGDIWKAARTEGYAETTLKRARRLVRVESVSIKAFPRKTVWRFRSDAPLARARTRGGSLDDGLTGLIAGHTVGPTSTVGPVGPSGQVPTRAGPTGPCACPNGPHGVHRAGCGG